MAMITASSKRDIDQQPIIAHAVRLYLRFSLSLRAVEGVLHDSGVKVTA
ncbi:MAG: hypothetical protein AAF968_09920 [Pseudomonadota bacterium]